MSIKFHLKGMIGMTLFTIKSLNLYYLYPIIVGTDI